MTSPISKKEKALEENTPESKQTFTLITATINGVVKTTVHSSITAATAHLQKHHENDLFSFSIYSTYKKSKP